MVSLRQLVSHLPGSDRWVAAGAFGSRSAFNRERRARERRKEINPFESRNARLRFAAQAAGFGTYDLDCATGDSIWSPELRGMAGLPPGTHPLTTEEVDFLIHPDDRQGFLELLQASLDPAGSGEFENEHRLSRPDGAICWVRTKGRTFFVGEGEERRPLAATGIVMDITASRAARQALAESREELDSLVESAIDSIVTIDADQRIIRFNPSAARMFGCTSEDALGTTVERFMPERYRAEHPDKVRRFAESPAPAKVLDSPKRFVGLRANGEEFPFESTVTKVSVGGRCRMTTFLRDITDRVRVEDALRRSKEELELAVRGADIGTWRWNVRNDLIEWSPRQYQLFGIPADAALIPERIRAALHPDDREMVRAKAYQAMENGEEYQAEFRVIWPDGSTHCLESIGRVFYDTGGEVADAMHGITLDITERRKIAEALRRSKEDMELAIRGADIGTWHWNVRSGEVEFSERSRQLFGIGPDEPLTYERALSAFHPDDRESVIAAHHRALEEGEEYHIERRLLWPDGSLHWVQCIGRDFYDESSGEAIGMRGITIEVTARKAYEEFLKHSNENLESRVAQRTAELTKANEALAQSNLELQQFAYVAAHDLQTPLRSIGGFAQLLAESYRGRLDAQADVWLDTLVRSAQRMHDLIRDLLGYSRVDSQGSPFKPTDFNQLCREVLEALDGSIRGTSGKITLDPLPIVYGDRTQLGQLLQNLIDNGLKYHGQEAPRIHISASRSEGEWVFAVRDNGIGIARKHLESVFDIFRRLHTQKKYPGTGIGLAVCRRVVHRHGGRIWVESEPGRGSTFYFTLPDRAKAESALAA